jgi:sugar lactone lactonase YvrE
VPDVIIVKCSPRFLLVLCLVAIGACGGGGGGGRPPAQASAPTITAQPTALTVNAGQTAAFAVTATAAASYQWQRNGQAISGATAASYSLAPATSANNGDSYTVVVSNSGGSVTSAAAALRVTGVAIVAGQLGGIGFSDGTAAQARLWGPAALTLDAAGNLYVADYNTVRKITPDGTVSTLVGSARECGDVMGLGATARLCYPFALTIDAASNVYVGDGSNTVWRMDTNRFLTALPASFNCIGSLALVDPLLYVGDSCGNLVGSIETVNINTVAAATTIASLTGPLSGLGLDASGTVYTVSDTIIQVASTATVTTLAGTLNAPGSSDGIGAAAAFGCANYPVGPNIYGKNGAVAIATLPSGLSYVADFCNHTIRSVTPGGLVTTIAGSPGVAGAVDGIGTAARFFGPAALVADPLGNVFVADYLNGLIRKITPAGTVTTLTGQTPHAGSTDGAAAQAAFRYPWGVVADSAGNLYVTDSYNFVIRKVTPAGVVSTLAGTAGVSGYADGTGAAAKFALPQGIAIDAAGNLYVADNFNQVVRKVTQAGVVTTFAGTAGQVGGPFNQPTGVAVDAAGNVYITDMNGIYRADSAGNVAPLLVPLPQALAITIARSGTVFVTQGSGAGAVYSLSSTNSLVPLATAGFSSRLPGIVVGGDGNVYVSDLSNSLIKRIAPNGTVTDAASVSDLPLGTVPGGLPAKINSPSGLALLSTGNSVSLAVVDSFEHSLLRVDLP